MFNYSVVQTELAQSTWPSSAKAQLSPALPQLGRYTLSYVSSQLSATGSKFHAAEVAGLVSLAPRWYNLINSGEGDQISTEIARIVDSESQFMIEGIVAIIIDIRLNPALSTKLSENLSLVMSLVEIMNLDKLPERSVLDLIQNRAEDFFLFADAYMEIKRYCFYRTIDDDATELLGALEDALIGCNLVIGRTQLTLESGPSEPSVKNWIRDFVDHASETQTQGTFNIANYLANHPAVQNLDSTEQAALSSIIKLYTWFHQPLVTQAEIESYETDRTTITPTQYLSGQKLEVPPNYKPADSGGGQELSTPTAQPQSQSDFHMPQPKDMDLSTQPRSGLVFDQPTNIDIDEQAKLRAEEKRNQQAIQIKLEALKKRTGKDGEEDS